MIPISFQDKKIRQKNGHPSHRRFYGPRPITCWCGGAHRITVNLILLNKV
jgi:hypothetical protein